MVATDSIATAAGQVLRRSARDATSCAVDIGGAPQPWDRLPSRRSCAAPPAGGAAQLLVDQLAVQLSEDTLAPLLPEPMKPNVVLAPAPSDPL